jgi:hypothetical protein
MPAAARCGQLAEMGDLRTELDLLLGDLPSSAARARQVAAAPLFARRFS